MRCITYNQTPPYKVENISISYTKPHISYSEGVGLGDIKESCVSLQYEEEKNILDIGGGGCSIYAAAYKD